MIFEYFIFKIKSFYKYVQNLCGRMFRLYLIHEREYMQKKKFNIHDNSNTSCNKVSFYFILRFFSLIRLSSLVIHLCLKNTISCFYKFEVLNNTYFFLYSFARLKIHMNFLCLSYFKNTLFLNYKYQRFINVQCFGFRIWLTILRFCFCH